MARRLTVLCAILVVGLLAAWRMRLQGTDRTLDLEERTALPDAPEAGATELALVTANDAVQAPQREPVAVVESAGEWKDRRTKETKAVEDEPDATLIVRPIDKVSGAPLPRVRVSVMRSPPASSSSTYVDGSRGTLSTTPFTAPDGRAEFELPAGVDLRLTARGVDGIVGQAHCEIPPLEPGERRELTLEIPTGDDLHYFGRVLAREDKSPVASASIELIRGHSWVTQRNDEKPQPHYEETLLAETATDADGLFELWLPSWKSPTVRIRAAGFGEVLLQVGGEHDTPERARVVLLSRAASLRARILDAGGGALAEGTVRLWTESYHLREADHGEFSFPSLSDQQWSKSADPSGLCVLQGLPPDVPLHVEILRDGTAVKKDLPSLSLEAGEVREVEWRIDSGCRLEGSVIDQSGEAVQGRVIWLQRADHNAPKIFQKYHSGEVVVEARTGPDGLFAFADVSPGLWWVGPAAERNDWDAPYPQAIAPVAQVVEVLEGSFRQEILLRVHRGLYIRGQVLDPAGAPAHDVFVMGDTAVASWMFSADTGSDGAFALGPLVPGRYSLYAHGFKDADSEPVEASGGDEGVILRLKAGGSVSGRVLGEKGTGCAAEVTLALCDASDSGWRMNPTEEDGTFRVEGLPPGNYCLAAKASGQLVGALRNVSVQAGIETENLVVTLELGATLRVKYAGKGGYLHYRILSDGATIAGDGVPAGGSSETVVPAGHLVVECQWARADSGLDPAFERKEIDLGVGDDEELVFGGG